MTVEVRSLNHSRRVEFRPHGPYTRPWSDVWEQ